MSSRGFRLHSVAQIDGVDGPISGCDGADTNVSELRR